MLAFRAEENVDRWCRLRQIPRGETLPIELVWELGKESHSGKLCSDWRRDSPEEDEAVFARLGLTGDFWRFGES
jgi:hypothetical protein